MKKIIRNLIQIIFLSGIILFSGQAFAQSPHVIIISNSFYTDATLTINEGEQIIFEMSASASAIHPTVADNGTDWAGAIDLNPGEQSSPITLSVGTHGYHCTNHGAAGTGMHGTVTVTPLAGTHGAKASMFGLTIAPNPCENEVTLSIDQNNAELTQIRITNIIGNEVAIVDLSNKTTTGYRVDFSHLQPGVYFCNLYSAKGLLETRKLFRTK